MLNPKQLNTSLMATIIINQQQLHIHRQPAAQQPEVQEELALHIGNCLRRLPPHILCRCLRETFMLNWETIQQQTPAFKDLVTEWAILLARLDAETDDKR